MICAVLLAAAAFVFSNDVSVGGFRWGDAPVHAMDGVLIRDWVFAGPQAWIDPVGFAEKQYAYYPTLGIGRAYPPGFAVVEGLFFALFGVSVTVARCCTVAFGVAAVVGAYCVARRRRTVAGATFTAVALLVMPSVVFWTRQTMLEMPTLAVLIWLTFAVQCYLAKPNWRRWFAVISLLFAAVLFKQTALFIVPVVGLIMLLQAWRGQIPWRQFNVAAALVVVVLAVALLFLLWAGNSPTHAFQRALGASPWTGWINRTSLSFYALTFPAQIGWVILIPAAIGVVLSLRQVQWETAFWLLWFVVFMFMITYIHHKQPRYLFFAYFPIAVWAGLCVDRLLALLSRRIIPTAIAVVVMLGLVALAHQNPIAYRPDYGELVAEHADVIRGRFVFFEGRRDGDFIFAVRERLGNRQAVIIRGSKILYSCAADLQWHRSSYVSTVEGVSEALAPFGFSSLIVERENGTRAREADLLQEYLVSSAAFGRVSTRVLTARSPDLRGFARTIDVYVPRIPGSRSLRFMDIPIPMASKRLRVDLDELSGELAAVRRDG